MGSPAVPPPRRGCPTRSGATSRSRSQPGSSQAGGSIVLTTYQAGKVGMIGWDGRQVTLLFRDFPKPMGLDFDGPRMLLATPPSGHRAGQRPAAGLRVPRRATGPIRCALPAARHVRHGRSECP